jgi:transcriptional antiterminator Rof (Rho-off)
MTDYKPVDCALHSVYELAVMKKQMASLRWSDSNNTSHSEILLPLDVITENREEFLIVENSDHEQLKIRLDRIESFEIRN